MSVVAVGPFSPEQQENLRLAVARGGDSARFCMDAVSARWLLGDGAPPRVLVVDAAMNDVAALLTWVRGHAGLMGTVIVAVVPAASEDAFIEASLLGADDVIVRGDLGALTRRIAALSAYDPSLRPSANMGTALVAHASEERRRILGRVVRFAGFDVAFASSAAEVEQISTPPKLAVVSSELPARGGIRVMEAARERFASPELPYVVLTPGTTSGAVVGRSMAIAEHSPPDALLFAVNELMRPGGADQRASARILHAALCAYRPAGHLTHSLALTYNVSREGFYIRTLDAPERDTEIWLELRPPRETEVVHLRARVVWARRPGHGPGGAVPPGFGVRLVAEACPPMDLARYEQGYAQLSEQLRMVA